ncbi:MAG: GNAT family N-acetyltransferase [Candidatus Sericytochromatia bacterium]|nr:GNAT family N-acetyltransferase [Candidatus Tanganyikabacteria bacterium]
MAISEGARTRHLFAFRQAAVAVRPATASDAAAICDLARAFHAEHIERWGPDSAKQWPLKQIRSAISSRDACVVVAAIGGKLVGFANGAILDPEAGLRIGRIDTVFVLPGQRGSRVAEDLMTVLMDALAECGADSLELIVATQNTRAQAFFAKFGFGDGDRVMSVDVDLEVPA